MQGKNILLVLSVLDILFLLGSFFLPPNSPISLVAILVAAGIFIFALIESALLQQWYWFVIISLFNPVTGFIYYQTYPYSIPLIIKWYWFMGSILLSPFIVTGYSLFGPKKKSYLPITQTAFRQLILTNSFIGISIYIIANTLPALWTAYIGLDFYMVGSALAIIQVFRLKHGAWVDKNAFMIILFPFFGIMYAIFSPKVEED